MRPLSVLIVEDDADIREVLADVLECEGYSVMQAANGEEALWLLRSEPLPSAIVLDLMMPVMNGTEFRVAQLADPRLASIPVIVLTANVVATHDIERLAVAHSLMKPIRLEQLTTTLSRVSCPSQD
jgi:CheY-like chemotaxis protein